MKSILFPILMMILVNLDLIAQHSAYYELQLEQGVEKWTLNSNYHSVFEKEKHEQLRIKNWREFQYDNTNISEDLFDNRWSLEQPSPTDTWLLAMDAIDNIIISSGFLIGFYDWIPRFNDFIISTDKGNKWQLIRFESDTLLTGIEIFSSSIWVAGTKLAGKKGFVLKSSDIAKNWTEKLSIDSFMIVYNNFFEENTGVVFSVSETSSPINLKTFSTTDGGENWLSKSSTLNGYSEGLKNIHFSTIDTGWISFRNFNGLYSIQRTIDGGSSWVVQITDTLDELSFIKFYDTNYGWAIGEKVNYPSTNNLILYSTTNGGNNWSKSNFIQGGFYNIYGYDIHIQDSLNLWLAVSSSLNLNIYKSSDGGLTFNELSQIEGIDFQLGKIKFISETEGWFVANLGSVYYTSNGGYTWIKKNKSVTKEDLIAVDFLNNDRGWLASSENSIFMTSDEGVNWNIIYTDTSYRVIKDIDFVSEQKGFLIYHDYLYPTNSWIGSTENEGVNWQLSVYDSTIFSDLTFIDPNNGWVVGGRDENLLIMTTTDAGISWHQQTDINITGPSKINAIDFADQQQGFAVGDLGTILKTTNGGDSWRVAWGNINPNSFWVNYNITGIFLVDPLNCWVSGSGYISGNFITMIANSTDGGASWDTTSFIDSYSSDQIIFKNDLEGYSIGSKNFLTTDGGLSWDILQLPYYINKMYFNNENLGWAVGYGGRIFKYQDASVGIDEFSENLQPVSYLLYQNYPNPFNGYTAINYSIPKSSQVTLKIFNTLGQELETLVGAEKPAGTYEANWNAANLPSGVYFYQLKAADYVQTRKMILLK